jgi:riboflavin kinase/FMN adenylyltransferase
VEAHLLDFEGDLYGARVRLELHARLRDEERFAGPDALVARIREDAARARALLPGHAGDGV